MTDSKSLLVIYCSILLGLTTSYLVISSVVQYWQLRKIPGPPLAAWTNLWLMWHMNHRENFHNIRKRLHQKYGPVQRYGPNRVMFSDPAAIPIILGSTNIFPKVLCEDTSAPKLILPHRPQITDQRRHLLMDQRWHRSLL
jgi:hypothetical protein